MTGIKKANYSTKTSNLYQEKIGWGQSRDVGFKIIYCYLLFNEINRSIGVGIYLTIFTFVLIMISMIISMNYTLLSMVKINIIKMA